MKSDPYVEYRNIPDDNYGYFVSLNEHNEIMRYSNNGTAIYCCEDPPATPIKKLKSSVEHEKNEPNVVANLQHKFSENVTRKVHYRQHVFDLIFAILAVIFFAITTLSVYFILII